MSSMRRSCSVSLLSLSPYTASMFFEGAGTDGIVAMGRARLSHGYAQIGMSKWPSAKSGLHFGCYIYGSATNGEPMRCQIIRFKFRSSRTTANGSMIGVGCSRAFRTSTKQSASWFVEA